ncbi:MAG: hypothetical protein IPP12_00305 [Nitrospira sp.]|nr:hypothetical protein [Nitrospira sp.]
MKRWRSTQAQAHGQITSALQTLDEEIRRFKGCLADFALKIENMPEQQQFEFACPLSKRLTSDHEGCLIMGQPLRATNTSKQDLSHRRIKAL